MLPSTAINPRISPGFVIRRIKTLPALELIESFTSPAHKTNTPRGSWRSKKSIAPPGYVAVLRAALKSFKEACGSWQKKPFSLTVHVSQFSVASNPYGPFMVLLLCLQPRSNLKSAMRNALSEANWRESLPALPDTFSSGIADQFHR